MYLICSLCKQIFMFCSFFVADRKEQNKNGLSGSLTQQAACYNFEPMASVVAMNALHALMLFLRMQA